nr:pre-mRNA cleavage factor Im 25 kDa subunit 2-like [Cryptomonas sp.]
MEDCSKKNQLMKKKNIFFFRIFGICDYSFKNKKNFLGPSNLGKNIRHLITSNKCLYSKKYVGIVILVYFHNFPHILLIQNKNKNKTFCLPGGTVQNINESEKILEDLLRKKLFIEKRKISSFINIGRWVFPEIESRIKYPFSPPHSVSKKKELHIYLIEIKNQSNFEVNIKWDLLAVPLFEIGENVLKYGSIISKLPALLFSFLSNKNKIFI